ncbi:hypothetical protein H1C71_032603 [Ictidomys tridecemlineatus]|nr:hypothetical protein H1C71_032603 [Ictidomys tridecemlineatus]
MTQEEEKEQDRSLSPRAQEVPGREGRPSAAGHHPGGGGSTKPLGARLTKGARKVSQGRRSDLGLGRTRTGGGKEASRKSRGEGHLSPGLETSGDRQT